jgi:cholesterol oxidase
MLSTPWERRKSSYDIVIIGSGYGGAIAAARLAGANLNPKRSICILERGKEWKPGDYPEDLGGVLAATRGDPNPLGLYELLNYTDISVIKGSGLGGTSLVNANVAIVPDPDVFAEFNWPSAIHYDDLQPYYQRARQVLASTPHPRAMQLAKIKALSRRAAELGIEVEALHINVNFTIDGANPYGVQQKPCIDCGNCVTGCNVGAKNTLYMNYLPMAVAAGVTVHVQTKVEWLEKLAAGGWRIHLKHVNDDLSGKESTLDAGEIILSAGALNSTEILLRSEMHGLSVAPALGTKFSGNGDFFGLAYNGDYETDVLGYPHTQFPGAGDSAEPGPNIVGLIHYTDGLAESQRIGRQRTGASRSSGKGSGPHRWLARSEWSDGPFHALPGDGPGQRPGRDPIRSAFHGTRWTHSRFLGQSGAAADLHPHERRAAPPRPVAQRQLHLESHMEHAQTGAPDHRASVGWLSYGRRLPARRRGPVQPRLRG